MNATHGEEEKGRVLPFRRRERVPPKEPQEPVEGLGKFTESGEPDDYRQRMINNGLAMVACVVLVGLGVWIASTMADLRKKQECVLSGRRDCAKIVLPADPK
jgi:hypothetical protein